MMTTTRTSESTASGAAPSQLRLAFELGDRKWKLGFTTGLGQRPRIRQVSAGAVDQVLEEITRMKRRLKRPAQTPVVSCYEAGREAFSLHRYLVAHDITNHVVDSSSIEVPRRARRAKTDRLDLAALLTLLARYLAGDRRAWHVVRVPSVAAEDARQLHRTWHTLQNDRTPFLAQLEAARLWDGTPVPAGLKTRLTRVWAQLERVNEQSKQLEKERAAVSADESTAMGRVSRAAPGKMLRVRELVRVPVRNMGSLRGTGSETEGRASRLPV